MDKGYCPTQPHTAGIRATHVLAEEAGLAGIWRLLHPSEKGGFARAAGIEPKHR